MSLLTLQGIHLTVGDRHLLRGISLVVGDGERIGLVGPNGAGKSTLLRILAGDLPPDAGERTVRRDLRLGYLPQVPLLDGAATARDAVAAGLAGRAAVEAALQCVHDELAADLGPAQLERLLRRQERLEHELHELGGHDVGHRVEAMLDHLGVLDADARCSTLSGGQARRVALARLLLAEPDLLLLDEPTNHLDAEVTAWLEQFLADRAVPFVLVTHDRYFLDRLVDRVLELEHGLLHDYPGGYRDFLEQRALRVEVEAAQESSRLNLLRRETEWMKRGPPARTTKAKARIGRYSAMVAAAPEAAADDLLFRIPDGPRLGDRVVQLRSVSKSYGGKPVLSNLDLEIGPGSRVGIVGRNGAGKTTLLNLCSQLVAPDRGEVIVGQTVTFARIDQGRTDLDPARTVLEEVGRGNDYVAVGEHMLRIETFLDQFLFPGAQKHARIGTLSGGEKNRVLLAKLLCAGGNVLLLDEPTNDLDLMSLRALEEALVAFPGVVLVVSHDRWFLDRIATRIVHLDGNGHARVHEGDLSLLLEKMAAEAAALTSAAAPKQKASERAAAPKAKKLSTREEQELAGLPAKIERAEADLAKVDAELADPSVYTAAGRDRYERLTAARAELPAKVAALYARWEQLETIAEQARKDRGG